MDTTTRTNVTDTGYSYGGKDYTYETRMDANNNPYRVDVPVGTAPALNKAPDGTQPLVYGGQPKVSTTTISNTNKINEVPKMVSNFEQMQKKGISTDASGVPRYADGSQVPDYTDPTIPEGTSPIYGTVNGVGNRIVGYNTPVENGGMRATYLDSTGKSTEGTTAEDTQTNDLLESMKSSLDASTKTLIDNIQKKFDIRRREQTDINARQKAGYTNALLMGGATGQGSSAQYAPISSDGIIGAQEAFGVKQLADLDSEEADLIAQAKAAQESGNFKILEKKMALVEEKRKEKVAAATELNKTIAEQNKKLREQNIASVRDQNISDIYAQGITDVPGIISTLKKNGVNVTSQQVADTLKNIVPPGLDDLIKTLRSNGAPQDVIQKVLSSGNINDAYKSAGVYGAGGTGITGEYNRYVADATSRGQIPISYDDFQTRDTNRKVSIARAGASSTSSNVGGSKTYANDLDAFIDNVVNLIPTKFGQETFKTSMAKARTDADKIRTAATVVLKNSPAPVKEAFANQAVGMKEIDKAIALLDEGVKTGAVVNGKQYAYNVVGKDFDPKLAAINAHIVGAIQPYRNTVTGAAWGTQEDNEYASLFGSTKYEPRELKERLQRVKEIMQEKSVQGLSSQVDPFSTGENFFETKTTMTNNIVQGEDEAKATINTSYTTFTPETKTAVKALFNKNYTNAQVVEYLKAKGVLK